MTSSSFTPLCTRCGEEYPLERYRLGLRTCLECGEEEARRQVHTVVPMHKSNLVVVSPRELEMLRGISNKGGQISGAGQNSGTPTELTGRSRASEPQIQNIPLRTPTVERLRRKMIATRMFEPRRRTIRLSGGETPLPGGPWRKRRK